MCSNQEEVMTTYVYEAKKAPYNKIDQHTFAKKVTRMNAEITESFEI